MSKSRPIRKFSLLLCLALGLLAARPASSRGNPASLPGETSFCPGQVSSLAVLGDDLFVGTSGGLFLWSDDGGGTLRPLPGLDPRPIKNLLPEGSALIVTFGSLTTLRLEGWDPAEGRFQRKKPGSPPAEAPLRFSKGFPVRGEIPLGEFMGTATLGGGFFLGERPLPNTPRRITAASPWREGIVLGAPEGLFYLKRDESIRPLFENPCRDCRLTCFARWRGDVFAGTLDGGVVRLPGYDEIDARVGLMSRINALADGGDRLFIGTEAGLFSWNGRSMNRETALGKESVKALAGDGRNLFLSTPSGLKRYGLRTGKVDVLSIRKGAVLTLFQGDLYVGGMFGVWKVNLTTRFAVTRVLHEYVTGFAESGGALYAAGYYNGLWKFIGDGAEKVADGQFSAIAQAPGGLLLGTGTDGVMFIDLGDGERKSQLRPVLTTPTVTAMMGTEVLVYVGTQAGYATLPWTALPPGGVGLVRE